MVTLHGRLSQEGALQGTISAEGVLAGVLAAGGRARYSGPSVITPGDSPQTIRCAEMVMPQDVVIRAIPSNYGKISWNGVSLSVS